MLENVLSVWMEIISPLSMSYASISKKQKRQGQMRVKVPAVTQILTRIRRLSNASGAGALQISSMLVH